MAETERMPLTYQPRRGRRRSVPWHLVLLGATVAASAGVFHYLTADWYAYVGTGPGRWPKFEMPLPWKIAESTFVGCVAATPVVAGAYLLRLWARRRRKRGAHDIRPAGAGDA